MGRRLVDDEEDEEEDEEGPPGRLPVLSAARTTVCSREVPLPVVSGNTRLEAAVFWLLELKPGAEGVDEDVLAWLGLCRKKRFSSDWLLTSHPQVSTFIRLERV